MPIDFSPLLAPIPGDDPAGQDLSYDPVFDRIREARRADDPQLAQGDWQAELKVADWREAAALAEQVLRERSKDLQAAVWLAEAWIRRQGLDGAAAGFGLVQALLDQYWDTLHPRVDDGDLDERVGKLQSLGQAGREALLLSPLGSGADGVTLADWQVSREVDNLARQNRDAYEAVLAEGKITGETFDARLAASGALHLRESLHACGQAQAALAALRATIDQRFGPDAPSLAPLAETLGRIEQVLATAARGLGVLGADAAPPAEGGQGGDGVAAPAPRGAGEGAGRPEAPRTEGSAWRPTATNQPLARADALRTLGEIAGFFRRSEPHSPVAYLLERAIAWADLPLDQWLEEVVRDESVLSGIRDRVGLPRQDG